MSDYFAFGAVDVRGLRELQMALARIDETLRTRFREKLAELAEPVRRAAEDLAPQKIRNVKPGKYAGMRIGVTTASVYVAPAWRSRSPYLTRPAFGPLLLHDAMEPALNQHYPDLVAGAEEFIDSVTSESLTTL